MGALSVVYEINATCQGVSSFLILRFAMAAQNRSGFLGIWYVRISLLYCPGSESHQGLWRGLLQALTLTLLK